MAEFLHSNSLLLVGCLSIASFLAASKIAPLLSSALVSPDFIDAYYPGARAMAAGEGYRDSQGEFITHWPPGFSAFMVPFVQDSARDTYQVLRWVVGVLAALHAVLVYGLTRRFFDRAPAVLTTGIAVLWPPQLALGDPSGSEMLFATLTVGAMLLLLRAGDKALRIQEYALLGGGIGLLLGYGMLTKTLGIVVAGVALPWLIFVHRRKLVRMAASLVPLVLGIALVTGPWIATYQSHEGHLGFTSAGPATVWDGLQVYSDSDLVAAMHPSGARWSGSAEILSNFGHHAVKHPVEAAGILVDKALSAWYATQSGTFDRLLQAVQIPWLLLFLFGCAAVIQRGRQDLLLLACTVATVWAMTAAALSIYRYLAPFFPFVVIVSAWTIREVLRGESGEIWAGNRILR